jgi:hypothetical protein
MVWYTPIIDTLQSLASVYFTAHYMWMLVRRTSLFEITESFSSCSTTGMKQST